MAKGTKNRESLLVTHFFEKELSNNKELYKGILGALATGVTALSAFVFGVSPVAFAAQTQQPTVGGYYSESSNTAQHVQNLTYSINNNTAVKKSLSGVKSTVEVKASKDVKVSKEVKPSPYKFEDVVVYLNGKAIITKAQKFIANGTSYISLYDAQLLVNKITGDVNKPFSLSKTFGDRVPNNGDQWDGKTKTWYVGSTWADPMLIKNSHGNAIFDISSITVTHAPVIITKPPGDRANTTFVPIWYVQTMINQLIVAASNKIDTWNGAVSPARWLVGYYIKGDFKGNGGLGFGSFGSGKGVTSGNGGQPAPVTGPGFGIAPPK